MGLAVALRLRLVFGQILGRRHSGSGQTHIGGGDVFGGALFQQGARDGQIVAVRDDEGEATLKKFFKEKNRVRLEPANKTMKPIFRDRVEILGILVGVVRKY